MQLVGATESFIQKPYLVRAIGLSVLSAIGASLVVFVLYKFLYKQWSGFNAGNIPIHFSDIRIYSLLFVSLLIGGIIISLGSTYSASRKYLRSQIDELY